MIHAYAADKLIIADPALEPVVAAFKISEAASSWLTAITGGTASGGAGNDLLIGSNTSKTQLDGGLGNDTLIAGDGVRIL